MKPREGQPFAAEMELNQQEHLKMKRLICSIAVTVFAVAGTARTMAEDIICNGPFTGDADKVEVFGLCVLDGANVGNVVVHANTGGLSGTLLSVNGTVIRGKVQADAGHAFVLIAESTVLGDVKIKGGVGPIPPFLTVAGSGVVNSTIRNTLELDGNTIFVFAANNQVGGDLKVNKNTGYNVVSELGEEPFSAVVGGNTVDGKLQCKDNDPAVSPGLFPNVVSGDKQGQCSGEGF